MFLELNFTFRTSFLHLQYLSGVIKNYFEKDRSTVLTENGTFHSVNTNHVRHARISIFVKNIKDEICLLGSYTAPVKS